MGTRGNDRWLFERREKDGTSRYYLRARVPHDLGPVIGKREIKKSLKTSDRRIARSRLHAEASEVHMMFDAARRRTTEQPALTLSSIQMRQIVRAWFAKEEVARDEARRDFSSLDPDKLDQLVANLDEDEGHLTGDLDEWAPTGTANR